MRPPLVLLQPGSVTLADWRAIYRGAPIRLDPSSAPRIAESAAAAARILARHELLRAQVPGLGEDRHMQPDMEAAIALVRSGALAEAVTVELPGHA